MSHNVTTQELKNVIALSDLPDEHLQWIIDRTEYNEYEDGTVLFNTREPAMYMWILLEGKLDFYMDMNGTLVYYMSFENDRSSGGITGLIPHSRMKTSPGKSISVSKLRVLSLHKDYFGELEQLNSNFVQKLIGYMTERAKAFATVQLQHEKVSALGKLSAGIAHELNNPASAIARIAAELKKRLNANYDLISKLLADNFDAKHIENIRSLVNEKESKQKKTLSARERMQKEDEIADWLSANGIPDNIAAAETFSEFGFSTIDLENIRRELKGDTLADLLRWIENIIISDRLIVDLTDASTRISTLVGAIKSHVHMDRTNDAQRTNIHTDIENTLTLMGYKIRDKKITVKKTFCAEMPMVEAYIGELNQVWTNLIDNAIDALETNGELVIETSSGKKDITIRIIDNGAGIPKEIQSRIFDPFFTTKKIGQGTGIGLDVVKRIITRHHGVITVNSVPGKTEFVVCIPVSQVQESP